MGLAGPVDVVGILALAGDEPDVFPAAHGGADSGDPVMTSPPRSTGTARSDDASRTCSPMALPAALLLVFLFYSAAWAWAGACMALAPAPMALTMFW